MTLYDRVIAEVKIFLPPGEDVERFVKRQMTHVSVSPETLHSEQISGLAWWIGVSASIVISKDRAMLLRKRIEALQSTAA